VAKVGAARIRQDAAMSVAIRSVVTL